MMLFGKDGVEQAEVDRNSGALRVTPRPMSGSRFGTYAACLKTGTEAAGASAGLQVLSFRYPGTDDGRVCIVRRISAALTSLGTGFAAGVGMLDLVMAREFSVADTGGTVVAAGCAPQKRRSGPVQQAEVRVGSTGAVGLGTRTLDTVSLSSVTFGVTTAVNTVHLATTDLFRAKSDEQPLVFSYQEGFVIKATVPATGTWQGVFCVEWDEAESAAGF